MTGPSETGIPADALRRIPSSRQRFWRLALAVYWPALALATHWPRLDIPNPPMGPIGFDKLTHASCFGLLSLLLIHARVGGRALRPISHLVVGMFVAGIYATADELTQGFFERTVSGRDMAANLTGVAGVGAVVWWIRRGRAVRDGEAARGADGSDQPEAFVGHALLVSALTFASRLLGLVRDAVLAACFGLTTVTDAFWIGFVVPNLFRRLFGEGALTAALIPVYTDLLRRDRVGAQRLASLCVSLMAVILGIVTLIGELVLAALQRADRLSQDTQLAIRLAMIMLPYMPLVCVVAVVGGLLQVHRRFGVPAAAPMVLNVVMIGACLLATMGLRHSFDARGAIMFVALAVVVAGLLQLVWLVIIGVRCGLFTLHVAGAGSALRSVLVMMLPMVLGLAVFQINTLFDSLIAWSLSPKAGGPAALVALGWRVDYPVQAGGVTGLQYAQRLYQFPLGVFGVALATAIFPALARAASVQSAGGEAGTVVTVGRNRSNDAFRTTIQQGLRLTLFVGLPASVGLILVRLPLTRAIFERQAFTMEDSVRVATILAGYAAAVWAYSMVHVLTRAFYALKDARTPLVTSMVMVAVNVVLNLVFVWFLGAAALAWSTAVCAVGQAGVLLWALGRYVDRPVDAAVWTGWRGSALLTLIMAVVLLPITTVYHPAVLSRGAVAMELVAMVLVGIVVVVGGAWWLRCPELNWLLKRSR